MDEDILRTQLPHYLLADPEAAEGFKSVLRDFNLSKPFYGATPDDAPLQGDGWSGLLVVNSESLERRFIRGMIISNSCDVSIENKRYIPPNLTFVPIIDLGSVAESFSRSGLSNAQIEQRVELIRAQQITDMMFLPKGSDLDSDSVALFGDIHNVRLSSFLDAGGGKRVFRLSQFGHYLMLFKISIHFCRFNEGIVRNLN